jgi:thioredoxin-related protein
LFQLNKKYNDIYTMRKILFFTLMSLIGLQASLSAGEGWMTDFEAAKAKAAAENKPLLVDFSGSDWCGWCIKLNKEVFSQTAFQEYADDTLVLVELDFPRSKPQPAELKAQNEALARQYGIRGFPTVLVLSPDGKLIERTGYQRGGAEAYVAHIQSILASAK